MGATNLLESLSDNIAVDADKCIFCGLCAEKCILDNIRLKLATCRQGCPLELNCQGYVQLIARGEEAEAMAVVRQRLPFPGILGRICSQPCEDGCGHRETDGAPISIRALKRYLDDRFQDQEPALPDMKTATGKSVAVIGSGPAGLLAAYDLAVAGHAVTVFEKESAPGGMLRWAVPEFRLPQAVVERELKLLERMGVTFTCNIGIGAEKTLAELEKEFDAILIAIGLPGHLRLAIAGEDSAEVQHGLPFLKSVREGVLPTVGRKVVVIGGGNTAVDVAQTARRLGAESVQMVCLESRETMPAFEQEIEDAVAEGIELVCGWGNPTLQFDGERLHAASFQACVSVFDEKGRFQPRFDTAQSRVIEADMIIVAIGQQADHSVLTGSPFGADLFRQVDPVTGQTAIEKVFAAGDAVSGPSTVVAAMAEGRKAAESIRRFLDGTPLAYGRTYPGPVITEFDVDRNFGSSDPRMAPPRHRCQGKNDFNEIETGIIREVAVKEAKRCHSCGLPFGRYRTCWFCLPCEVVCPTNALWVNIPYLLR